MDKERVLQFLETSEGKHLLQPHIDRYVTKGLQTWKENHLENLIKEHELSKIDPHARKLNELNQMLENKKKVKNLRIRSSEIGIDAFVDVSVMMDLLVKLDEKEAFRTIEVLNEHFKEIYNKLLNEEIGSRFSKLANTPRYLGEGNVNNDRSLTKADIIKMNYEQRAKFYQESPERYRHIMNS